MGVNQSIDKSVPEEFGINSARRTTPKVGHFPETKSHSFHTEPPKPAKLVPSPTYRVMSELDVLSQVSTSSPKHKKLSLLPSGKTQSRLGNIWESLPLNSSFKILEYCIDDIPNLLVTSQPWRTRIKNILYYKTAGIVNKFKNMYYKQLRFVDQKIVLKKISIKQTGNNKLQAIKMDLQIVCKVDPCLVNKTVSLCYKYQLHNRPKNELYSNYVFDVIPQKTPKTLWVSHEQRKVNLDFTQNDKRHLVYKYIPCMQLRPEEEIRVSVSLYSPGGTTIVDSICWVDLHLSPRPSINFQKKVEKSDHLRVCEYESMCSWVPNPAPAIKQEIHNSGFSSQFKLLGLYSSGLDFVYIKAVLEAITEGTLGV